MFQRPLPRIARKMCVCAEHVIAHLFQKADPGADKPSDGHRRVAAVEGGSNAAAQAMAHDHDVGNLSPSTANSSAADVP